MLSSKVQRVASGEERLTARKLAAIAPKVYQVFEVLGFPSIFDITGTVEEAVARFASGEPPKGE